MIGEALECGFLELMFVLSLWIVTFFFGVKGWLAGHKQTKIDRPKAPPPSCPKSHLKEGSPLDEMTSKKIEASPDDRGLGSERTPSPLIFCAAAT